MPIFTPPRWYNRWRARWRVSSMEDRNILVLYLEIIGSGFVNVLASFNAVFAVRLGASNQLIGWMSSIPALIVALLTLPSGQLLERSQKRLPLILGTLFLYRSGFLVIALMPFFVTQGRDWALVLIVLCMAAPLPLIGVGWNTIFAEMVPTERRATVVAYRNVILVTTVTILGVVAGWSLDLIEFPFNYQVVYIVGFIGAMGGQLLLTRLQVPGDLTPAPSSAAGRTLSWAGIRRLFQDHPGYRRITLNTLIYGIGPWMVTPLFSIYYVRELGASNTWIGTLTSLINLTGIAGYYFGQKLVRRSGERPMLVWSTIASGLYPALIALIPALTPILFLGGLYGLANAALNLSHFSTLLKVVPQANRPSALALYTLIMNLGAFVSPVVGVALADRIGVRPMLIVGTLFWVAGGIMHFIWPPEGGLSPSPKSNIIASNATSPQE